MSNFCQIIMMFPYSPTSWDAKKFGFDHFIKKGINLEILDMSALVSTRSDNQADFIKEKYIKKIKSYAEFEDFVSKVTKKAIFFDGINAIGGLKWPSRHIFKILKKYHVDYFIIELGALPIFGKTTSQTIYQKIKKAFSFNKAFAYSKWKIETLLIHLQWKFFKSYHLPEKIFSGNSASLSRYLKKYNILHSKVSYIHSYDYDRYLSYLRDQPKPLYPDQKIIVFLDQMLAYHPDFGKNVSFAPVTAQKYYSSLHTFFDRIENQFGMKVIIASSPRATHEKNRSLFQNREVVIGKTIELVAECELVLMHSSTAVSFAVLFNKPIMMLKTNEMLHAHGFSNFMDRMANLLNIKPICIDELNVTLSTINDFSIDYDSYKYQYIMTKHLQDKLSWEIIIDDLITWSHAKNLAIF